MIYICTHREFLESRTGDDYTILSNRELTDEYKNKVTVVSRDNKFDHALSDGSQIYWLWKNQKTLPDIVGVCRYRRYFLGGDTSLTGCDVILPKAKMVNLEGQYKKFHNISDLQECWNIINLYYPEYSMRFSDINVFYHYNMFVMKKSDFCAYCDFVFGVLKYFCKRKGFTCDTDILEYVKKSGNGKEGECRYQARLLGFLMERIGTVFFLKYFKDKVVKEMPVERVENYEKKLDVLYIVGTGSKFNNEELKFSLRTLDKNVSGIGRIFIVGHIPEFIDTKKVVCLPCPDPYDRAHKNMLYKLEYAIMHSDISNDFLMSADDHFYINKCDFGHYPFYYRNMLKDKKIVEGNVYTQSLKETREFLESHGYPSYDFSQHINTHCNVEIFKKYVLPLAHESYDTVYGIESMSLMLNVWLKHEPFVPVKRKDKKLMGKMTIKDLDRKAECISVADDAYESFVRGYLQKRYPDKSRWEK